jgi:hypothetical protein
MVPGFFYKPSPKVLWPNLFVRSKKPILEIFHIFLRLPFYFFLDLEPYSVLGDNLYILRKFNLKAAL